MKTYIALYAVIIVNSKCDWQLPLDPIYVNIYVAEGGGKQHTPPPWMETHFEYLFNE